MLIDGIWQRVKDIEQNDNTIVYIIAIKSFPKNFGWKYNQWYWHKVSLYKSNGYLLLMVNFMLFRDLKYYVLWQYIPRLTREVFVSYYVAQCFLVLWNIFAMKWQLRTRLRTCEENRYFSNNCLRCKQTPLIRSIMVFGSKLSHKLLSLMLQHSIFLLLNMGE